MNHKTTRCQSKLKVESLIALILFGLFIGAGSMQAAILHGSNLLIKAGKGIQLQAKSYTYSFPDAATTPPNNQQNGDYSQLPVSLQPDNEGSGPVLRDFWDESAAPPVFMYTEMNQDGQDGFIPDNNSIGNLFEPLDVLVSVSFDIITNGNTYPITMWFALDGSGYLLTALGYNYGLALAPSQNINSDGIIYLVDTNHDINGKPAPIVKFVSTVYGQVYQFNIDQP